MLDPKSTKLKCLRCNNEMQAGYIMDTDLGTSRVSKWIEGESESNSSENETEAKEREIRSISTYRCVVCGYLDLYAK